MATYNDYATMAQLLDKHIVMQMEDTILLDRPDRTPLLSFLVKNVAAGTTRTVQDVTFWWLKKKTPPPYIPLADDYTANDLEFLVTAGEGVWFAPNQIVFLNNLQYRVVSITPGVGNDTIVVELFPSTQVDENATTGANIIMSYEVYGERAEAPKGNFTDVTVEYNYIEQMMKGITVTDLMERIQKYGKSVRTMEHQLALDRFKTDIEMKFLLSRRHKDDSGEATPGVGTVWNTGGINERITEKVVDFNGEAFDIETLFAYLPSLLEFSEPEEILFYANADFLFQLQLLAMNKMFYDTKDNSFGYAVRKWDTSLGSFPLLYAKMLDYFPTPVCYLINKKDIKQVNFKGLPDANGGVQLTLNAQLKTQPNVIHDFFRAFKGFQWGWEKRHAKLIDWQKIDVE